MPKNPEGRRGKNLCPQLPTVRYPVVPPRPLMDMIRERLARTASSVKLALTADELSEENKNKLDLKPNVAFVAEHIGRFQEGLARLMARPTSEQGVALANKVTFSEEGDIVHPQLTPDEIRTLLRVMPPALAEISQLEHISYHKVIHVPGFDAKGNFDPKQVQLVPAAEFPREGDHPSRVLVGVSNGTNIFPTPIPPTVSDNSEAVKMYQTHVFIHEFFHTIEILFRDPAIRSMITLETDGVQFTFQEWWEAFEILMVSSIEPRAVSMYAATCSDDLDRDLATENPQKFTHALAEQMAETFVAYLLNIISNKEGWVDFKNESFGNHQQVLAQNNDSTLAANLKWGLMDKLFRAKTI